MPPFSLSAHLAREHRCVAVVCEADRRSPGLRPDYGTDYYAAFVVDPDGYRIEAYFGG